LILGEYSGFARNLKKGFESLGHQVLLVTDGNAQKKIVIDKNDIRFRFARAYYVRGVEIPFTKKIHSLINNVHINCKILSISGKFDIVLLINAEFLLGCVLEDVGISLSLLKTKLKNDGKLVLSACSYDPAYYEYEHLLKYSPFVGNGATVTRKYDTDCHKRLFYKTLQNVDLIIPTDYAYKFTMSTYMEDRGIRSKLSSPIILPYDVKAVEQYYPENKKLVILHGIIGSRNRELLKGSNHILNALKKLECKYGSHVEILNPSGLSLNDYIKILRNADILIDQAYSYGLGMNAVMGLAYGKVVLGGKEKETVEAFGLDDIPMINILPDEDQIFNALENLVLNRELVSSIKHSARDFAERVVDSQVVATQYLDALYN